MTLDRECNDCNASDWTHVFEADYPESRSERDRTVKTVYACESCDGEGRHFEHKDGGADTYSGALR